MTRTIRRFGRRSVIATHQNGHAFFSSSGRDYDENERSAVSQLDALARIVSVARAMRKMRAA